MPTYYVATTGNDTTGDGSAGLPWLTLTKAETAASNGDTVNVGAGTFQEATYWTPAKAITWVGAGSSSTIVRGNNATRAIYLNSTNTKTFTGFGIDGLSSGTAPAYHIEGSAVNQATTFTNCNFTNAKTTTLRMNSGMLGVTLSNCTCTIGATQTAFVSDQGGASGWTVDGCTITGGTGLVMSAIFYQAVAVTSGTFTVNNCDITMLSNYAPFRIFAGGYTAGTITNNRITVASNNARTIVELKDINGTLNFSGNTLTLPATTSTIPFRIWSTVDTGPDTLVTCEDNVIYTYNNSDYGLLIGDEGGDVNSEAGAFNGSSIRRNRLYFGPYFGYAMSNAHGIMMGGNTNFYFEDNYLYGAAYCFAAKGYGEAWTAGYCQNNVFENCTYSVRMKGQSSIRCVNNVIYSDGSLAGTSLAITDNGAGQDSDNAFLRNNLCIRDAAYVYEFADASYATSDLDYQGVYLTGTATMGSKIPLTYYTTLADWQAGTGKELNAISGNPKIQSNFTIQADSPFFEKGIPVTGVTHIYDTTKTYEMTLAGAASLVLDSPYKKRQPIT